MSKRTKYTVRVFERRVWESSLVDEQGVYVGGSSKRSSAKEAITESLANVSRGYPETVSGIDIDIEHYDISGNLIEWK